MSNRLAIRALLAALLSALAAAFCVAILLSGWFLVEAWSEGSASPAALVSRFFSGVVLLTVLGTMVAGPFSIAFALLTQLPLALAYRRFGYPSAAMHILVTIVLGPPLFLTLFPLMTGGDAWGFDRKPNGGEIVAMTLATGAVGGAAVGSVWYWLVFKALSVRKTSHG